MMLLQPSQRSSLELLLLALVKLGVNTTYELMTKAGLSVGITSRSLRRLEAAKLLISSAGTRSSQRFEITKSGERELKKFSPSGPHQDSPVTFEFVLRVLYLGWLSGNLSAAATYGGWAIDELHRRAQQQIVEAAGIKQRYPQLWRSDGPGNDQLSTSALASVHKQLKIIADAEVTEAQARALEIAIRELHDLPQASRVGAAAIQEEMFGRHPDVTTPEPKRKKS
jgi:DNA-binding PadR family transcriptional regulator